MYIMNKHGDIMKTIKELGLLDKDFLGAFALMVLPVVLKVLGVS